MNYDDLIGQINSETYEKLKHAVETGKWPNGAPLSTEQKNSCLQAIIAWDIKHKPENERIGYIEPRVHSHCAESGEVTGVGSNERPVSEAGERTIRWSQQDE